MTTRRKPSEGRSGDRPAIAVRPPVNRSLLPLLAAASCAVWADVRVDGLGDDEMTENVRAHVTSSRETCAAAPADVRRIGSIERDATVLGAPLIDAYLNLRPGQPYRSDDLAAAQRALADSGFFRRVQLVPEFGRAANGSIPIRVELEPMPRIEYTAGASMASNTGLRLKGGYRIRRFNSRGHRSTGDVTLSSITKEIAGEYRRPLRDPRTHWMTFSGGVLAKDTSTSRSEAVRAGFRRSKRIGPSLQRTWRLDLSVDRFVVGRTARTSRLAVPGFSLDHKRTGPGLDADHGRQLVLEVRAAHRSSGSDASFVQAVVRSRWMRAVGDKGQLRVRGDAGVTLVDAFADLPPALRFFAGGNNTVRGFGNESLGPADEGGAVVGGMRTLTASVEYQRRLPGNLGWAVFVDGGNAFNGSRLQPAFGAGVGLLWRSPAGPLALYAAKPVGRFGGGVRLHLDIGGDL